MLTYSDKKAFYKRHPKAKMPVLKRVSNKMKCTMYGKKVICPYCYHSQIVPSLYFEHLKCDQCTVFIPKLELFIITPKAK